MLLCYRDGLFSSNLKNQPLLVSNFSSAAYSSLPACTELKRVRVLLWIRLRFKRMLWLVWFSIQTTKTFSISAVRKFHFLIIHVFPWCNTFNFLQELFLCTYNLTNCLANRPSFQPVSAFSIPSSLCLISSFQFKLRKMWLLPSLEDLLLLLLLSRFSCVRLCATP